MTRFQVSDSKERVLSFPAPPGAGLMLGRWTELPGGWGAGSVGSTGCWRWVWQCQACSLKKWQRLFVCLTAVGCGSMSWGRLAPCKKQEHNLAPLNWFANVLKNCGNSFKFYFHSNFGGKHNEKRNSAPRNGERERSSILFYFYPGYQESKLTMNTSLFEFQIFLWAQKET